MSDLALIGFATPPKKRSWTKSAIVNLWVSNPVTDAMRASNTERFLSRIWNYRAVVLSLLLYGILFVNVTTEKVVPIILFAALLTLAAIAAIRVADMT